MAIKMSPIKGVKNKEGKIKVKKPWYDKVNKILMILAIIATCIGLFYTLSPVAPFIAALFLFIIGIFVAVIPSVFTLFILPFTSESYRNLVGKFFTTGDAIWKKAVNFKDLIASPYPIIMGISGAVIALFLVTSILLYVKKSSEDIHHEHRGKMIVSIVLAVLFIIFTIISFVLLFKI